MDKETRKKIRRHKIDREYFLTNYWYHDRCIKILEKNDAKEVKNE